MSPGKRIPSMQAGAGEFARFSRIRPLGVDVLHARFLTHAYARHSHDALVIGIFERGSVRYSFRGGVERCGPRSLMVFDPDEAHDGIPEPGGFVKRVVYIPVDTLTTTLGSSGTFGRSRLDDPDLWERWRLWLRDAPHETDPLTAENEFTMLLATTFARWSYAPHAAARSRSGLRRARERLLEESDRNIPLVELAADAGLSRAEFVRQFSEAFGLPPHAYQVNARLRHARRMLDRGGTLAAAAAASGFFDQAHLARHFVRAFGISPGRYAKSARSYKTGVMRAS